MLIIRSAAEIADALASPLDDEIKRLLAQHRHRLAEFEGYDLNELAFFVVVEPGDTVGSIKDALSFHPLASREDGRRFGDPGFLPSWELLQRHTAWTELVFILTDDGFGCVLLISDLCDIDATLRCLAVPAPDGTTAPD